VFASQSLPRLNVRLPAIMKAWVAQEAADRNCPMNTVVLDAMSTRMNLASIEQMNKKHDAAIKLAISVAQVPKGTAIILQSDRPKLKTDILVKGSADADYSVLARVCGEEIIFFDNSTTNTADEIGA
jgi:hypothetical protein